MCFWSNGVRGLRIADFGKEQLKSDEIHNKIPQSTIPNPQSNRSNTPGNFFAWQGQLILTTLIDQPID
jgi:hypothetical protein